MSELPAPRTSPAALVSFLLGLASLALFALTGLPALLLGLRGLREVNASDGRLRGRWLALTGLALGGLATTVTVVWALAEVALRLRATSHRTECVNNLRQLGLALNGHLDAHGAFPPAAILNPRLPPQRRLSWLAAILPDLGEGTPAGKRYEDLAGRLDRRRAWDAPANALVVRTPIPLFLCPAHPDYAPRSSSFTTYVGIAGVGLDAANLPRTDPRAGMFGYDRGVKLREVTALISSVMMVTETAEDNGPWAAGGHPTVRGVDPATTQYIGPDRPFGGLHRGGLNVLYVDLSVRWLSDAVEPEVFRTQATIADRPEPPPQP
jgi:prepilin-type processing-associated H-X9-DG protein